MSSLPNLARVRFQPPEDIPHSEKQLIILCMSLILCNLRIFIQILEYFSTSCQLKWMVPGKALRFPKSKGHCSTWGHGFTMDIIHQNLETKQNITKPPNKERIKTQCVPCFIIKNPHLPTKIENSLGIPHLGHRNRPSLASSELVLRCCLRSKSFGFWFQRSLRSPWRSRMAGPKSGWVSLFIYTSIY